MCQCEQRCSDSFVIRGNAKGWRKEVCSSTMMRRVSVWGVTVVIRERRLRRRKTIRNVSKRGAVSVDFRVERKVDERQEDDGKGSICGDGSFDQGLHES